MRTLSTVISSLQLVPFLAGPASAQTSAPGAAPVLHVSDAHSTCFFDLHSDLTQKEFEEFAGELGSSCASGRDAFLN